MPRDQGYHRQNTPRRSNQYYFALVNTGTYNSTPGSAEHQHARYIARTQVVHNENLDINIRPAASRYLRNHNQSQTRRRVAPLATFPTQDKQNNPLVILKIIVTCPCFSQNDLICFC